ncbi:glucose-1-phosphate adenylyltransferase subunit GlgD [Thermohalobacter berrensis]|uniref:Glucose-1-phosphate adenylyltransferase subunit GlgD n=1 Tax=Thermohalobacter berrensis TaxID=99594 RepID=A0A419T084_9FIRM|nr:glucose-1-phosphate adenylyltransferase subunit GlgD [Thermohalobacter berrensis]RKD30872.1 glucose-1-phosphate adenylyltransferase subunit GlgD [Thermohalobacter berrensis]
MKDLMGIINLSEKEDEIRELTHHRPLAAIPIAGRYRVIDFILSNMVNAGIENVFVFTQAKSRPLINHLRIGKEWDLDRKIDGLFVFNPVVNNYNFVSTRGDMANFKNYLGYIKKSRQKYVILSKSYMLCNIDFIDAYEFHKESGADITIVYKRVKSDNKRFLNCDTLNLDEKGNVISVGKNLGTKEDSNISMEMYIMKKELLLEIIEEAIIMGSADYLKQAIVKNIESLDVNSYPYEGYLACINSINNYFKTSRELLNIDIYNRLFYENGPVYTRVKDEPPTKYTNSSEVINSVVANGCVIEGTVENSIIGRGVKIKKGAVIKDSVIMQRCTIEEGVNLKNVILDKSAHITKNKVLHGDSESPLVIKKSIKL